MPWLALPSSLRRRSRGTIAALATVWPAWSFQDRDGGVDPREATPAGTRREATGGACRDGEVERHRIRLGRQTADARDRVVARLAVRKDRPVIGAPLPRVSRDPQGCNPMKARGDVAVHRLARVALEGEYSAARSSTASEGRLREADDEARTPRTPPTRTFRLKRHFVFLQALSTSELSGLFPG